ncbi:hypothetical protein GOP47_0027503 [Adiantum capillus-veneris]|nr:hypothetical protein GOP47_0027503 [Adiantum capillus-veneris]
MRRALGGLLLSTRKARAEKCLLHFHQAHHPQEDQRHIPFFTQTLFCFTSASGSSPHTDPHVTTFPTTLPSSSLQSTKIHDAKLAARDLTHCVARGDLFAEKIAVRDFSHGVAHCDFSTEEDTSEDSPRCVPSQDLSTNEARKLLKLMKVEDFKKHMHSTGKHCMPLEEVVDLCKQTGTANNDAEAGDVLKSLDEAGAILIFRRKVFLEPEKVAEALSRAMPLPLGQENDPRNQELARLQKEKEEIDTIAHKQVRNMLWGAFGVLSAQSAIFFRLTFWELSWDVMEPITFFVTSSSLLAGFFFFVITKRDPSYHDFMDTLFSSKQRKLMKKRNFDVERFKELQVLIADGQKYIIYRMHMQFDSLPIPLSQECPLAISRNAYAHVQTTATSCRVNEGFL